MKISNLITTFSLDQNYSDLNYNELGMTLDLNPMKIDFSYLSQNTLAINSILKQKSIS